MPSARLDDRKMHDFEARNQVPRELRSRHCVRWSEQHGFTLTSFCATWNGRASCDNLGDGQTCASCASLRLSVLRTKLDFSLAHRGQRSWVFSWLRRAHHQASRVVRKSRRPHADTTRGGARPSATRSRGMQSRIFPVFRNSSHSSSGLPSRLVGVVARDDRPPRYRPHRKPVVCAVTEM